MLTWSLLIVLCPRGKQSYAVPVDVRVLERKGGLVEVVGEGRGRSLMRSQREGQVLLVEVEVEVEVDVDPRFPL